VWETLRGYYSEITKKVIEVEQKIGDKTGEERQKVVVNYICDMIDIPYVPSFIETPVKRALVGRAVDMVVEKLNVICDWDFRNAKLSEANIQAIAEITAAPVAPLLDIVKGTPSKASLDEKFDAVLLKYNELQVMSDWDAAINFALKWEGGRNYAGDAEGVYEMINKADKGGPTAYGITRPTLAAAYQEKVISHQDLDKLTLDEAKAIYRKNYYDRYGFGELTKPVDLCALDCSINHGGFAWILQRALVDCGAKLTIDGKFGPATRDELKATCKNEPKALALAICKQRFIYYNKIVEKDAGQKANLKGWTNRVNAMAEAAGVEWRAELPVNG
jgi:lysozyme family protein